MTPFCVHAKVSKRLKAAFIAANNRKIMAAEIVHRGQGTDLILGRISLGQILADFEADLEAAAAVAASARPSDSGRSYNSVNYASNVAWYARRGLGG
ncbi:unnamed protein product [Phytophthora fragariaefolia]|uniref:Unnamed protein product n=1 Tax=Phytophthora fragariaefolia TaxID=1490495 RepID=A0A9W6XS51_9STRA|nr:unnamed protein product [Phytophthora fragariaefolia]